MCIWTSYYEMGLLTNKEKSFISFYNEILAAICLVKYPKINVEINLIFFNWIGKFEDVLTS